MSVKIIAFSTRLSTYSYQIRLQMVKLQLCQWIFKDIYNFFSASGEFSFTWDDCVFLPESFTKVSQKIIIFSNIPGFWRDQRDIVPGLIFPQLMSFCSLLRILNPFTFNYLSKEADIFFSEAQSAMISLNPNIWIPYRTVFSPSYDGSRSNITYGRQN